MKRLLMIMLATGLCGIAHAESPEFDFEAPPFWTLSFDEIVDLKTSRIETYLHGLEKITKQIPEMADVTYDEMMTATDQKSAWHELQTRVYRFCKNQDPRSKELCTQAAGLRKKLYASAGNQKIENRMAEAKRQKEEREKKSPRPHSKPVQR